MSLPSYRCSTSLFDCFTDLVKPTPEKLDLPLVGVDGGIDRADTAAASGDLEDGVREAFLPLKTLVRVFDHPDPAFNLVYVCKHEQI